MLIIYYFSHRLSNTLIGDWVFYFFPIVWRDLCIHIYQVLRSENIYVRLRNAGGINA